VAAFLFAGVFIAIPQKRSLLQEAIREEDSADVKVQGPLLNVLGVLALTGIQFLLGVGCFSNKEQRKFIISVAIILLGISMSKLPPLFRILQVLAIMVGICAVLLYLLYRFQNKLLYINGTLRIFF